MGGSPSGMKYMFAFVQINYVDNKNYIVSLALLGTSLNIETIIISVRLENWSDTNMEPTEIQIPVLWGHIAAKTWGDVNEKLVLLLHGEYDNAGSFDRLIPYLSKQYYYVCVDLPGCGKSSPFPKNAPVQNINVVMSLKIVLETLKRDKIILIGHCWGGHVSSLFAQIYPEVIEKLILIEAVCFPPLSIQEFKKFSTDYVEKIIEILTKSDENCQRYTFEDALKLIMNRGLKREAAECLLKRSFTKLNDTHYALGDDLRNTAKFSTFLTTKYVIKLFKWHNIKCPVLFVFAKNSETRIDDYENILNEIKKTNKNCIIKEVNGGSNIHNNTPEVVAPVINEFLNKLNSNL